MRAWGHDGFLAFGNLLGAVRDGKIKAYAVTSDKRLPSAPTMK